MLKWLLFAEICCILAGIAGISLFSWKIALILVGIIGFLLCERAGAEIKAKTRGNP